jgi:hypothetical protein
METVKNASTLEILSTSKDLSPKEKYFLTLAPSVKKMKDAISQIIEITAWCFYSDTNSKGEAQEILSILTPENEVYATNSPTFKEDFFKMLNAFAEWGEPVHSILVSSGTSKAGREFITCVYAD